LLIVGGLSYRIHLPPTRRPQAGGRPLVYLCQAFMRSSLSILGASL
jgi:hypothetical protein